jgi:hypothetical protein
LQKPIGNIREPAAFVFTAGPHKKNVLKSVMRPQSFEVEQIALINRRLTKCRDVFAERFFLGGSDIPVD